MLTIDNKGRTQRVALRLRRRARQTMWSQPFLIALGISLFMHLGGWVVFRFPQLQLNSLSTHTPVVVDSHLFDASAPATEAYLGNHPSKPPLPPSILTPTSVRPSLPSSPKPRTYVAAQSMTEWKYSPSSSKDLGPVTQRVSVPVLLDPEHVDIRLSGPLVEYTSSPPKSVWYPTPDSDRLTHPSTLRYTVQAQPHTGQLVWWEKEDDVELPQELLSAAEAILRQLRLHIAADTPLITGEVALTFYPERWKP